MKRFVFFLALFLGLLTITVLGCASTPHAKLTDSIQIPLHVENNVSQSMTIYTTPDGVVTRRIGDCNGMSRCVFVLDERTSRRAIENGVLEIGFRHFGDQARGPTTYMSTPAWEGMQANLVVNYIDNHMTPYSRHQVEAK